jgi:hypothetical protein
MVHNAKAVIEDLQVTSSMTSPMGAAMLEVFFSRDALMEIMLENGRK